MSYKNKRRNQGSQTPPSPIRNALRLLNAPDAFARVEGELALVFSRPRGVTLRTGSLNLNVLRRLISDGAVMQQTGRTHEAYVVSDAGRALLHRLEAEGDGFQAQHAFYERLQVLPGEAAVTVNIAESPLLWLHRRGALPGDAEFAAGERLRADMTLARTLPSLGVDLERMPGSGVAMGMDPSEARVAASQRVRAALAATGPELAGVLVDVCGFLKRLELVETERGWPQRSAKLVLSLALTALARHYGLSNAAIGERGRRRRHAFTRPDARNEFELEAAAE